MNSTCNNRIRNTCQTNAYLHLQSYSGDHAVFRVPEWNAGNHSVAFCRQLSLPIWTVHITAVTPSARSLPQSRSINAADAAIRFTISGSVSPTLSRRYEPPVMYSVRSTTASAADCNNPPSSRRASLINTDAESRWTLLLLICWLRTS